MKTLYVTKQYDHENTLAIICCTDNKERTLYELRRLNDLHGANTMSNIKRKDLFPHDKRITIIRANLTTYKEWASVNLALTHGWTDTEIRVSQAIDATTPRRESIL